MWVKGLGREEGGREGEVGRGGTRPGSPWVRSREMQTMAKGPPAGILGVVEHVLQEGVSAAAGALTSSMYTSSCAFRPHCRASAARGGGVEAPAHTPQGAAAADPVEDLAARGREPQAKQHWTTLNNTEQH